MCESHLSQKISLCRCIETLNDDGCLKAIRLLQHFQKYKHLNQFLIKVVLQATDKMDTESLQRMTTEMKEISCNCKYVQMKQSLDNKSKKREKSVSIHDDKTVIVFPLFRLPVDIISNTSLFLNEKDIFSFEQCCRLFYQIINKLSYLKQTNNFKTFIIDDKRFNHMMKPKHSFYKYSQTRTLKITKNALGDVVYYQLPKFVNQTHIKWKQAKYMAKYNGDWLMNVFRSVESLTLPGDATMMLLDKLPLKILFDPQSRLRRFSINHQWNDKGDFPHLQRAIDEFEKQYFQLKEKYQQQGQTIKKLKWLEYSFNDTDYKVTGPRYIEAEHLILHKVRHDFAAPHLFSAIHVLTCNSFDELSMLDTLDKIDCNIDTLRLINFHAHNKADICVNDKLIRALNLHDSLINLTIEINVGSWWTSTHHITKWLKGIETILCKQYYHNLQNVNILFKMLQWVDIDNVFEMLKKHVSILKYQFKQLNIGLKYLYKCCTFEWNPQIDETYLNKQKQKMHGNERKFKQWLNQWTN